MAEAKRRKIIYPDQIFLTESAPLYPTEIEFERTFKHNTKVHFRALKPSDEENMRQFFYRLSTQSVAFRFFYPIQTMFHSDMQEYVNIDYRYSLSLVGLPDDPDCNRIIAEARFDRLDFETPYAELSFMVDEGYQNVGIGSCLCEKLTLLAKARQIKGFTADILTQNKKMRRVFHKMGWDIKAKRSGGIERLTMEF